MDSKSAFFSRCQDGPIVLEFQHLAVSRIWLNEDVECGGNRANHDLFTSMAKTSNSNPKLKLRPAHDWRTTDTDEINKRRQRASEESFVITNTDARHPIFSNFRVKSASGLTYSVEIRNVRDDQSACDCVDFRTNGLALCKHTEAVRLHLQARHKKLFKSAQLAGSNRIEVTVDPVADTLSVLNGQGKLPPGVGRWFNDNGRLNGTPETALDALRRLRDADPPQIRI